jgi:hypothetical protein
MSTESTVALRDATLVEFKPADGASDKVADALARAATELGLPASERPIYRATEEARLTLYLHDIPRDVAAERIATVLRKELGPLADGEIEVSRLAAVRAYVGASPDATPHFHYVVRTDVELGSEQELERWYDEEHMQALAAVPGVVRAERLVSLDASPRYYACYDLVSPDVRFSPEWLAVRETDWSGRVRPKFRDTRRIVSRRIDRT